jgi:plastocyanin
VSGDLFYEPTEFEVAPGGTITLTNEGMLEHNLAVDEWGGEIIEVLAGGESGTYQVPDDAAAGDSFEFYCSVPGHKEAGMVGKVTVV